MLNVTDRGNISILHISKLQQLASAAKRFAVEVTVDFHQQDTGWQHNDVMSGVCS